jgi:hypothetical protein
VDADLADARCADSHRRLERLRCPREAGEEAMTDSLEKRVRELLELEREAAVHGNPKHLNDARTSIAKELAESWLAQQQEIKDAHRALIEADKESERLTELLKEACRMGGRGGFFYWRKDMREDEPNLYKAIDDELGWVPHG